MRTTPSSSSRAAMAIGGLLLAASGAIHLDLFLTGYRTIPTIGTLFLLQSVLAFVLAVGLLLYGSPVVAFCGALFSAGTFGGYVLALRFGLFGFKEVRTSAGTAAGLVELAAALVLALTVVMSLDAGSPRGRARVALVVAVGAMAALLVAGILPTGMARTRGRHSIVTTRRIKGERVLTTAGGRTLYWFARDSRGVSRCYGTCASYWPPLLGRAVGHGLGGKLGVTVRADGTLQATYGGRPLYLYVGDERPGEATGNGIDLNGGVWHDVVVSS